MISAMKKFLILQIILCCTILSVKYASALDSLTLLATLVGENENDFMVECATAGDVNGDGFKDIIIGATQITMDRGYAYIYFGGLEFDIIPDVTLIGEPFSPAGFSNFGWEVASAGDVNNDGYDDVIVAADFGWNDQIWWPTGKVFLFFGGVNMDSIPDVIFQGSYEDHERFGYSISSAGDVNDDGYDDIIISAPFYPGGWASGRAYIYLGGENMDDQFDICIQGGEEDCLGNTVKSIGDINQDGYDDVLIGAPCDGPTGFEGRASIYFGGNPMDTIPDVTFWGDSTNFQMVGIWIAGAGDVNGDGIPDVMISASSKVKLFFGSPQMDTIADLILTGEEPLTQPFSYKISSAGDLNRDGFGDIMIAHSTFGDSGEGKVYVFYGGPDMDTIFDITLIGDYEKWANFGRCISPGQDINGDDYDEILISSDEKQSTMKGKIFIYTSKPASAVGSEEEQVVQRFHLYQNYPNPFNSLTAILFGVESSKSKVPINTTLRIYNIRGQLVTTLVHEERESGTYRVIWDGKDNSGREVASGIYFYQLRMGNLKEERKMLLLK